MHRGEKELVTNYSPNPSTALPSAPCLRTVATPSLHTEVFTPSLSVQVTNYSQLCELSHVLQKCDDIFSEARSSDMAVVPRSLSSADLSSQGSESTCAEAG